MNRSLQIRAGLSVIVLLVSLIGLWPTFQALSIDKEERAAAKGNPERLAEIEEIDSKAIRRGLDLKGGMYLVLEIDQSDMTPAEAQDALQRVKESLVRRIDKFGVSEPEITTFGASRIVVKLPGLQDPERAKNLLGKTARLEFRLVRPDTELQDVLEKLDRAFLDEAAVAAAKATDSPAEGDDLIAQADSTAGGEENPFGSLEPDQTEDVSDALYLAEHPFSGYLIAQPGLGGTGATLFLDEKDVVHLQTLLDDPRTSRVMRDAEFQLGDKPLDLGEGISFRPMYLVDGVPALTGDRLEGAVATNDNENIGRFQVSFTLDSRGARSFAKMTGDNVGRKLAISLDSRISSAPTIQSRIGGGQGVITGNFTNNEASDLALLLRAGALPADVHIVEERTVGPSLGSDSIQKGVSAAMYGSIFVILFMLAYYRLSGFITVIALVSNIIILMAVLAQFGLVLTLPGIAGIILTVGMAVDANVLINERIREELRKDKTIRASVQSGYMNATRTIIDANVTTLIAGGILLMFGTGPIKGFAVTLSIGILTSMFTALIMTRVIMELTTRKQGKQTISI
jgi:SecD/SecF fusion protein